MQSIQKTILNELHPKLSELQLSITDISLTESLLKQGIFDSITFLEFIVHLEEVFSVEFDFSELDPTEFTAVENLVQLIQTHQKTKIHE